MNSNSETECRPRRDWLRRGRLQRGLLQRVLPCAVWIVLYLAAGWLLIRGISAGDDWPAGAETMYHLFRGDAWYQAMRRGTIWPLYSPYWYNGVELLRYEAPLPALLCAVCEAVAGGNFFAGYLAAVCVLYAAGALVWLVIGIRLRRSILCGFLGLIWFFLPGNLYALFVLGDLGCAMVQVLFPGILLLIRKVLGEGQAQPASRRSGGSGSLALVTGWVLMILSSADYAVMAALAVLVGTILYAAGNHIRRGQVLRLFLLIFSAFLITGVWLYASFMDRLVSGGSAETLGRFFQSLGVTLNPAARLSRTAGGRETWYFGLPLFLLAILGVLGAGRDAVPGFIMGILLCLLGGNTAYSVMKALPGGQYLQMLRYIPIASAFILVSFSLWKTLKERFQILVCVLLVLDLLPPLFPAAGVLLPSESAGSAPAEMTDSSTETAGFDLDAVQKVEKRLSQEADAMLLTEAKAVTRQRLALLDGGSTGAEGAFLVSGFGTPVRGAFGDGWEAAADAPNIRQLNQALEDGYYPYLFDRCADLGNDTVLIRTDAFNELDAAAERSGYRLLDANGAYRLYQMSEETSAGADSQKTDKTSSGKNLQKVEDWPSPGAEQQLEGRWGTVTDYDGIGIGTAADSISLAYPNVKETGDPNLNHYTFEELSGYEVVYLAGFSYDSLQEAENLVRQLADSGVRVVILADGIPENRESRSREFLGVTCNPIEFENGYPILHLEGQGDIDCDMFPRGYLHWRTFYLNGLDSELGTITDNGAVLPFYGTKYRENVVFLGLNLPYHYYLTRDENSGGILHEVLAMEPGQLPERTIVPLSVTETDEGITIESPEDGVNTAIAWHEMFRPENPETVSDDNHLLRVNAGTTAIRFSYPHLIPGLIMTAAGLFLAAVCLAHQKRIN